MCECAAFNLGELNGKNSVSDFIRSNEIDTGHWASKNTMQFYQTGQLSCQYVTAVEIN